MQPPAWKQNEVFPIIVQLIAGEDAPHMRLISAREIGARLLLNREARAVIDAARQHQPEESAEQLADNIAASFGQSAIAVGSEWQSVVEAVQISGDWFFRLKPQTIASHESIQTATQRAA